MTLDQFASVWVRFAWVWTGLGPSWVSLVPLDHLGTQTRYEGDDPGILTTMPGGAPGGGVVGSLSTLKCSKGPRIEPTVS